jgi:acyl CoA:acetate/3-ketoacid CoA transferase beta subunit
MEHTTKDGTPKLVERCGYPLTAMGAVQRLYTNLAVVDVVAGRGFVVRDIVPGLSLADVQAKTSATLHADG